MWQPWVLLATAPWVRVLAATTTLAGHDSADLDQNETVVEHHTDSHEEHIHPHVAILFPFISMLIGLTITHITSRCTCLATIPYTVSLLIVGWGIGFLDVETSGGLGTLSQSISLWIAMDPHLLLYVFLPVLLFGDAMSIVWHDFQRTAAQCMVLAGPGVLIGTALIYLVAKFIFPYGWGDFECAAFGSVLAATDPVAVVGLLKEMGASRVLTMQIAGESLLNDGVAIVVWLVFYNLMKGEEAGADIILSFVRLAVGGTAFGILCGLIGARWMSLASDRLVHSDSLVQVTLTITVAYISFFAGENELKLSGVLATIFAALMVGKYAHPLVCNQDGLGAVWHLLEFFGNTILFVLCGVFSYTSTKNVQWADYGWLALLYVLANLARGLMIGVLWPVMNCVGGSDVTRTTWRECLVMTWGGLRGAVGLALVLSMRNLLILQGKEYTANLMVFFVSGFATLTLLVNATTCGLLLKYLGLTKPPEAKTAILATLRQELMIASKKAFSDALAFDGRFKAVNQRELDAMLEHLEEELGEPFKELEKSTGSPFSHRGGVHPEPRTDLESTGGTTEGVREDSTQVFVSKAGSDGKTEARALQAWGHWWWGFEEVKVERGVAVRRDQSNNSLQNQKRNGVAAKGTQQERVVYRKLFLSMLRAEYMRLMDVGMLPRRASGAEQLLASIDAADDFATIGLNDWKILEKRVLHRRNSMIVKVREMLSPYFAHLLMQKGEQYFDLFTVVAFIDAHHTVAHRLLKSECLSFDARADVIGESQAEIEAAHQLLKDNGIGAHYISKVRTVQLAAMLFETQKEQVARWKHEGIISAKEMEELLHLIKHGLDQSQELLKKKVVNDGEVSPSGKATFLPVVFWHFKAWALNPGTFLAWSSLGRSTAFVKLPSWRWLGIEGALISIPEELLEMTEWIAGQVLTGGLRRGPDIGDADPNSKRRRTSTDGEGGGMVMDIGANFGQSSERYLHAGFKVVAVEPNPAAAKAIRERLAAPINSGQLILEDVRHVRAGDPMESLSSHGWHPEAMAFLHGLSFEDLKKTLGSLADDWSLEDFEEVVHEAKKQKLKVDREDRAFVRDPLSFRKEKAWTDGGGRADLSDSSQGIQMARARAMLPRAVWPNRLHAMGRRPNTLRQHVRLARKFNTYMRAAYVHQWFRHSGDVMEYVALRLEEPCGKSVPSSIWSTLKFLEMSAEVPESKRISSDLSLKNFFDEISRHPAWAVSSVRTSAKRLPLAVAASWECMVVRKEERSYVRIFAWFKLLKLWAALRWDDTLGIPPSSIELLRGRGLRGKIVRSKTTGDGKRVDVQDFYVAFDSWLVASEWLSVGWSLFCEMGRSYGNQGRDFLLPRPDRRMDGFRGSMVRYADALSMSRALANDLQKVELSDSEVSRKLIIIPDVSGYWSEHSERVTMVSWAAALKIDSESRRRWGRWKPSTDEEYAKTTLTMVLAAQKEVAEKLRHSWGGADLVEDEVLLQELGKWLEERCFTEHEIDEQLRRLRQTYRGRRWRRSDDQQVLELEDGSPTGEADSPLPLADAGSSDPLPLEDAAVDLEANALEAEKIGKLNPELQSLLDARRVDPAIQAALYDAGVDTMGMLAAIAISRAELQTFAKDVLGVDPSAVPGDMVRFATVFLSWQSASNRIKVQDEHNSELAAQKQPKSIPPLEMASLKQQFEKLYYKLKESETPARASFEDLCEQLDAGSLEELRSTLVLMGNHFIFARLRYSNKATLATLSPFTFLDYIGYIMGKHVAQMETQTVDGIALHRPSVKLLVNYDHQMRKEVVDQMNEGQEMADQLHVVIKNADIRERHFSTPLAVSSAAQSLEGGRGKGDHDRKYQPYPPPKGGKGKKGKDGKGKHKGKYKGEFLHSTTPDGRQLCFAWNNKAEGCKGGCNRVHACRICLSTSHATFEHRGAAEAEQPPAGGTGEVEPRPQPTILLQQEDGDLDLSSKRRKTGDEGKAPTLGAPTLGQSMQGPTLGAPTLGQSVQGPSLGAPTLGQSMQGQSSREMADGQSMLGQSSHEMGQSPHEMAGGSGQSMQAGPEIGSLGGRSCCRGPQLAGRRAQIQVRYKGKIRRVADGLGKCSAGLRPAGSRPRCRSKAAESMSGLFWSEVSNFVDSLGKDERLRLMAKLALGRYQESPSAGWIDDLKEKVDSLATKLGKNPRRKTNDRVTEINFRRLKALAELVEDEDHTYLATMASRGVPLGVRGEIGKVTSAYDLKTKNEEDSRPPAWEEEMKLADRSNYKSATAHLEMVKEHILDDAKKGWVVEMSREEAVRRFGDELQIASLGAVPKDPNWTDVRVVHDATHGLQVNVKVDQPNKMEYPQFDDLQAMMGAFQQHQPGRRMLMAFDIKAAHRLVPIQPEDWGLQACKLEEEGNVWCNTRGTFGVTTASFWWGRVASTTFRVLHRLWPEGALCYLLLFADDGLLMAGGEDYHKLILSLFIFLDLLEIPLSWKKTRGGFKTEWIGYTVDLEDWKIGVSEKKVAWRGPHGVLGWGDQWCSSILGAPLCNGITRVSNTSFVELHMAVRLALEFFADWLGREPMKSPAEPPGVAGEVFRVDAMASDLGICIGGWETYETSDPAKARWFSLTLDRKTCPWLYVRGEPHRTIAASELLAVTVAVVVFGPRAKWRKKHGRLVLSGFTDNASNSFVIDKFLSVKFPVSMVLMELSRQLAELQSELQLHWIPREQNEESDDLSKGKFDAFDPANRIEVDMASMDWKEKAIWNGSSAKLYVNKEDSEWSSCFQTVGSRYDTEAIELDVEATNLSALFERYGTPLYLKLDTEGADGMILEQLAAMSRKPSFLSFELNSLAYLKQAAEQGYRDFKVVPQGHHKAKHLLDEHGRPLTHAGDFGEEAVGVSGLSWIGQGEATQLCRRLCFVHDEHRDVQSFAAGPPRYVDRDFATLRACFPVESKNDEEWYDIHCRHQTAAKEENSAINLDCFDRGLQEFLTKSDYFWQPLSIKVLAMASKPLPGWVAFSTSGVGGIFGWLFIHPVNTLAIRMNLASMQNPGAKLSFFSFASETVKTTGIMGLYDGLGAGIWRQIFYASSRYGLDTLAKHREVDFVSRLTCATAAGGMAALISCPCEVSLVRLSNDATLDPSVRRNYKGVVDCAQRIAREEGVAAFWRGSMPFVTRACLVGATQVLQELEEQCGANDEKVEDLEARQKERLQAAWPEAPPKPAAATTAAATTAPFYSLAPEAETPLPAAWREAPPKATATAATTAATTATTTATTATRAAATAAATVPRRSYHREPATCAAAFSLKARPRRRKGSARLNSSAFLRSASMFYCRLF
eukprot:symbB.v1.2.017800.t1/scaffold1394.1/size200789/23